MTICGGPDIPDNAIRVCKSCNSSKGGKRLYEWVGLKHKDEIARIVEGKYLKLLYGLNERLGTLDVDRQQLTSALCPKCDEGHLCELEGRVGKLTVYCLEGLFCRK